MRVEIAVEGWTDAFVARKLIEYVGHEPGGVFGQRGINDLRAKAHGLNVRARYGAAMLMLVDFMDTGLACPPQVLAHWLPERSPRLLLRVAVRALESWLLADRDGLARFLDIAPARVPADPEALPHPKRDLVALARRSRLRQRREAIVPAAGISAVVGPGYVTELATFVREYWQIEAARRRAPSLDRCVARLQELP